MKIIRVCFFSTALQIQLGLSYARQGLEFKRQGEELVSMISRLENMELNTLLDPDKFFEDAYGDMQELGQIIQQGRNLAYSTGNLDAAFRDKHKDFDEWAQLNIQDFNPDLLSNLAKEWNKNSEDSVLAALKHTNIQFDDLNDERTAVAALKDQTDTVEGRMQAIQAISSIGLEQLQQTQKLRAAINNMTALQANFYAQASERQAVQDAFDKIRDENTASPLKKTETENGQVLY